MFPPPLRLWPRLGRLHLPGFPPGGRRQTWTVSASILVVLAAVNVVLHAESPGAPSTPPVAAPPPAPAIGITGGAASAGDVKPVGIITDDPTCAAWEPITAALNTTLADGWHRRDPATPSSQWTAEQRRQYRAAAGAMREAAEKAVALAARTPHRVMRELYEQSSAYWRSYADGVDDYRPTHDHLARAAGEAAGSIQSICAAIDFGVAEFRNPLVLPGLPAIPDGAIPRALRPTRLVTEASAFCAEWTSMVTDYDGRTREWRDRHDPDVPASHASPDVHRLSAEVAQVMRQNADQSQLLGLLSGNLAVADLAALSSQYRRAFATALPTYGLPDRHLDDAATRLQSLTDQACRAVSR